MTSQRQTLVFHCHVVCSLWYRENGRCSSGVPVQVGATVVQVLGHVGEGLVTELTLVKRVRSVGLPVRSHRRKTSIKESSSHPPTRPAPQCPHLVLYLCMMSVISVV